MIGEYAKLGKRYEYNALLVSAVWKAFVFGLLVFAFHIVEDDSKQKALVWRGIADNTLSNNGNKNQKNVEKAVEKMFKQ
jgi:hypothetical protein